MRKSGGSVGSEVVEMGWFVEGVVVLMEWGEWERRGLGEEGGEWYVKGVWMGDVWGMGVGEVGGGEEGGDEEGERNDDGDVDGGGWEGGYVKVEEVEGVVDGGGRDGGGDGVVG